MNPVSLQRIIGTFLDWANLKAKEIDVPESLQKSIGVSGDIQTEMQSDVSHQNTKQIPELVLEEPQKILQRDLSEVTHGPNEGQSLRKLWNQNEDDENTKSDNQSLKSESVKNAETIVAPVRVNLPDKRDLEIELKWDENSHDHNSQDDSESEFESDETEPQAESEFKEISLKDLQKSRFLKKS